MNSFLCLLVLALCLTATVVDTLPLHDVSRPSPDFAAAVNAAKAHTLMKKDKYSHGSGTNNYGNGKDYNTAAKVTAMETEIARAMGTRIALVSVAQAIIVAWSGDALTWTSSARNTAGWAVSSQPKAPSIIVIQPGNQGVGSDGHVAVVERIESDGEVYTSNYNYNGGPYVKTYVTFKTGNGVSFIWHD
ncbi:hypothetical protein K493DRAFT_299100 [Basidiobolus meristosporus CBS 931.73]|uniref:Peptidase C51 domain-containing protein n=1 Tax=Basidiobolus meristosporus CBS 931.73 TaxID=1314790 RepID=A0A1Y1YPG8_9FUNG|nr:hypothetical protein K493DRAFT_299100 [Basidiobolus meristosporus CBS 931.73]|eukprot:ORX99901.1 hypothetical protein K493DRAFT_299100 [Basidiobolus meristosporus CBS 931.73]